MQFDPARKSEIQVAGAAFLDMISETDPTPATNPLQAVVDDLTGQLELRTIERDNAIGAHNSLVASLNGIRTNLEQLLAALPTA